MTRPEQSAILYRVPLYYFVSYLFAIMYSYLLTARANVCILLYMG